MTGGAYVLDEWTVLPALKLNFGARGCLLPQDPALSLSVDWWRERILSVHEGGVSRGISRARFSVDKGESGGGEPVTVESNPNLNVERSRSAMAELNAYLFVGEWWRKSGMSVQATAIPI